MAELGLEASHLPPSTIPFLPFESPCRDAGNEPSHTWGPAGFTSVFFGFIYGKQPLEKTLLCCPWGSGKVIQLLNLEMPLHGSDIKWTHLALYSHLHLILPAAQ